MRAPLFILFACVSCIVAATAHADARLDEFKARIEAALAIDDKDERDSALGALFYRGALDEMSESFADRMIEALADHLIGKLAEIQGLDISFAPLSPATETHDVVDGYEDRPNLEPLGYVVFTDPAVAPGNYTKILYGLHPTEQRYSFPLWERQLVNPDAPPDK